MILRSENISDRGHKTKCPKCKKKNFNIIEFHLKIAVVCANCNCEMLGFNKKNTQVDEIVKEVSKIEEIKPSL